MVGNFDRLLEAALCIKEKRVVVIYPNNTETFDAVREAAKMKLASFVLVGDENLICGSLGDDLGRLSNSVKLVSQSNVHSALRASIELIRDGHGDILLKGGIDTSTMMKAVFILEFPRRSDNKFIMITDGGITPAPDLKNKVEIIVNAVEVAHALGNPNPKVAILSATEFVVPNLQSTIDAAALSKMNDRGQIRGCLVDGPFALDNTISMEAVGEKRIKSEVAGRAEILIAANIESANSLAKSTTYFAGLRLAHVIVGGRVPILIPSRADKSDAKLLSMALGIIMSDHYQQRGAM
jgi:phosphate butyryltransferase